MNNILEDMYYGRILPFWEHSIETAEYRERIQAGPSAVTKGRRKCQNTSLK